MENDNLISEMWVYHPYVQRFWRAFLGANAFSAWELLISFNDEATGTNTARSIALLSDLFGQGDRATLLGREARNGYAPQKGLLAVLEEAGLITIETHGEGTQVSYRFDVRDRVPLLSPEQVSRLSARVQRHHRSYVRQRFGRELASRYPLPATEKRAYLSLEEALRNYILARDKGTCAYCGGDADTVDHVIPRVQGGSDDPSNLVACCQRCNSSKNGRTPDEAGMALLGADARP